MAHGWARQVPTTCHAVRNIYIKKQIDCTWSSTAGISASFSRHAAGLFSIFSKETIWGPAPPVDRTKLLRMEPGGTPETEKIAQVARGTQVFGYHQTIIGARNNTLEWRRLCTVRISQCPDIPRELTVTAFLALSNRRFILV